MELWAICLNLSPQIWLRNRHLRFIIEFELAFCSLFSGLRICVTFCLCLLGVFLSSVSMGSTVEDENKKIEHCACKYSHKKSNFPFMLFVDANVLGKKMSPWIPRSSHWPQWPMPFFHKHPLMHPHGCRLNGKLSCTALRNCCFVLIFLLRVGSQLPRSN